jgi:hypothetical protein
MIFVYEKGTNKYIGMAPQIFDNGVTRDFTLEELYPNLDPKKYGSFIVEDSSKYALDPDHWRFTFDKNGVPNGWEFNPKLAIRMSTDAPDTDGDGMPELPADGESTATITIQMMDGQKQHKGEAEIKVSTTGGRLDKRVVKTNKQGRASVQLTSVKETITITVSAAGLTEDYQKDSITFELMP